MTRLEAAKLPWECTFGAKSHMNIAGKILLSPLILIFCVAISFCELCFTSSDEFDT